MKQMPRVVDSKGRSIQLERELGSGYEGAVFAIANDPKRAAKLYHERPPSDKVEKLAAMVALVNPKLLEVATWPSELLYDAPTRQPVGFVMPRLVDYQEIWRLYQPVERIKMFPRAGWKFQVRAARNLAAAFDEVHGAGCVVGDVQLKNAQVSPQALVRLVDCDSFQILANGKRFLCDVGLPHYIPPELQGKPLRGLVRTPNHDRFGLAVLIYQLLFVGRHPYSGVYRGAGDPPYNQLIAEYRFAQGPMANSWGMAPPPNTPTFSDIPPDLGMLFRRAFERGSETGTRPRASDWLPILKQLELSIAECHDDPGHTYWRGAAKCVWCRLETRGGPEYYFGVAGGASTFAIDEAKLQEVMKRLNACKLMEFRCDREQFAPSQPPIAQPLPRNLNEHRTTLAIVGTAIGLSVLMMPFGLIRGFICAIGFLSAVIFGIWLTVLLVQSPKRREMYRRRQSRKRTLNTLKDVEDEWFTAVRRYRRDHKELSQSVNGLVSECRGLASRYQSELHRLAANAEAAARIRHMRLFSIADADIPNIGAGRKQTLSSNNIFTACDVEEVRIRGIKGFGDALTNALTTWRDEKLASFRFDPKTAVSPAEQRPMTAKIRARQGEILSELDRGLTKLAKLAPICLASVQKLIPALQTAVAEWEQAEVDFELLKGIR